MVPSRIAFVALGLACVTAAGVGGYLGTRHNVTEMPAAAAQSAQAETPAALPAAANASQPAPLPDLAPAEPPKQAPSSADTATSRPAPAAQTAASAKRPSTGQKPREVAAVQNDQQPAIPDHGPAPIAQPPSAEPVLSQHPDERPADAAHA